MRTILITGATDGIGLALARLYRQQSARLILVGRRPLAMLQGDAFEAGLFTPESYCQVDLAQSDCATVVAGFLAAQGIDHLDVLINNAAGAYAGRLQDQTSASIQTVVDVNLWAPLALTHTLLPHLERAQGKVVFISSVVSAVPTPNIVVYGATKAGLDGLARSLRLELEGQVRVQVVHPGGTRTSIFAKSGDKMQVRRAESPEQVAAQIAQAVESDQSVVNIGRGVSSVRFWGQYTQVMDRRQRRRHGVEGVALERPADQPPHCVITGAADGIGRALALRYARAGYAITGIDINAERAAQTQAEMEALGASVSFIQADLRYEWDWVAHLAPADVFIHNAGVLQIGRFSKLSLEIQRTILGVNLLAPLQITPRLLQERKLYQGGSLVFISSLARYTGFPGGAAYAATKTALAHYARSLGVILTPHQHVLTVFPGPVTTGMDRQYASDGSGAQRRLSPQEAAEFIFQAQQKKRSLLLPGRGMRLIAAMGQIAPGRLEAYLKRTVYEQLE